MTLSSSSTPLQHFIRTGIKTEETWAEVSQEVGLGKFVRLSAACFTTVMHRENWDNQKVQKLIKLLDTSTPRYFSASIAVRTPR